ncbi:phage portal protein [Rickettsiales endosymbiont of Stachyamoeba lipophora]|uniref:phage portal protein n=1 Tax=Rickettsiales endosymbiont of Stachyamoeba lipophora TaxID=2486578 RepID=UPI000F650899|nr:phage portal protein [Rickettsiales endosymbiont of Stachyamoeba lipophora]AZL15558.1 phage portal protein [Rickettsiales endosymbiont of Stachyamoeba lipophora]
MFNKLKQVFTNTNYEHKYSHNLRTKFNSYLEGPKSPVWMNRNYTQFADEAYCKNVIAYRSINLIAKNASNVDWQVGRIAPNNKFELLANHPLNALLNKPNPLFSGAAFIEALIHYLLLAGNAYIQLTKLNNNLQELFLLRPDRVAIIKNGSQVPLAYQYKSGREEEYFHVETLTGKSDILHLKYFHPLDDFYGLSPIEAAAYSIDQHNQAAKWNQALLQNGARPSGALIVQGDNNLDSHLNDDQYERLKQQISENFSGSANAGKPLLLEGGLKWQEMSLSNKDMEFLEAKNSAAREIALAFGVPPQLLGIPGDNTYSNLQEARLALWEETILPLLNYISTSFNNWFKHFYNEDIHIRYNAESISALTNRREILWQKLSKADYLTLNEKRAILGFEPLRDGDSIK